LIVSLHVASGAAAGALVGSRAGAIALGPVLHALGDYMPHGDIESFGFERNSGLAGIALLALTRGPLDPATLGAIAASAPDLDHIIGETKAFPSHRFEGWHRGGGVPAWAQLLVAGALLGLLVSRRATRPSSA
jgi:hypothetical protein